MRPASERIVTFDSPRYLVLHREGPVRTYDEHGEPEVLPPRDRYYDVHGGLNPTLFKTLRMSLKAVRDRYTWIKASKAERRSDGLILLFDVNYLPVVGHGDQIFEHPGLADRLSDTEFCERQVQLWNDQLLAARERESAPPTVHVGGG